MSTLTQSERQMLRAKAHSLKPVVMIGEKGLTEPVIKEIERALFDHELIKVRLAAPSHEARDAMIAAICEAHHAKQIQRIGNILVVYKKREKE